VEVGMKREDIIVILGNPTSSNKISNKYGNYEEMIYSSNRFVYLENNIVKVVK
jgi:outer membrane protein assembly factor BamE (lipoprotein component of BamABCDE complex)